jgi:hypothetical protein
LRQRTSTRRPGAFGQKPASNLRIGGDTQPQLAAATEAAGILNLP